MRITKIMLEERLHNCQSQINQLEQDNAVLKSHLKFVNSFTPQPTMVIAMEKITEALDHTISNLKRR